MRREFRSLTRRELSSPDEADIEARERRAARVLCSR
jgi:hypothetical protein